jgi:hypothetical protein
MNLQDRDVELNWREVTCKRSVQDDNFARGIQDFDFSVSGKNAFIPSLSYFLIDAELLMVPKKFPRMDDGLPVSKISQNADLTLTTATSFRRPMVSDGIALADHFGSTLYNNAFFRAGNSDVSLITQYIPQAGVLKSRLDKSNAWSRNIGRIVFQDDADFERRRQYISFDGTFHDDGLKPVQYTEIFDAVQAGNVGSANMALNDIGVALVKDPGAYPRASFLKVVRPPLQIPAAAVAIGVAAAGGAPNTHIPGASAGGSQVDAAAFGTVAASADTGVFTVIEQADNAKINFDVSAIPNNTVVVFGDPAADPNTGVFIKLLYRLGNPAAGTSTWAAEIMGGNDDDVNEGPLTSILIPHDPACGSSITQVMFQPPIGIFSEANAISGGDFKISLNPSPSYATNGIQSIMPLTAGTSAAPFNYDYKLNIKNVKFYVATIKSDVSPTGVIPLTLIEMAVLNKTLNQSGGLQNLDFTVPPSTLAITVFVQGGDAGTQTVIPATKFYLQGNGGVTNSTTLNPITGLPLGLYNNIANNVQNIQVTYGSITKTQTLYSSGYDSNSGVNNNVQRFLQSIQYSGKITSEGGAESHPQYLERGNYWHFDFSKDKNDTSSYVNVQISFLNANIGQSQNLFIVAHYSRQCEISYENGFITQVVSVNR